MIRELRTIRYTPSDDTVMPSAYAVLVAATRPEDHAVTFFTRTVAAHSADEARNEVLSMREATENGWRVNTIQVVA
jgi:hypothetical protein